jgi:uncharacterized protein (TIGR03437 family)
MLRAIAALMLFVPVLGAQTTNNWTQQNPESGPPMRTSFAMAYDSDHSKVVLFGGAGSTVMNLNLGDTWVWDGSTWTQESPMTSPPAENSHAMAYDSLHGQVVLFGRQGMWLWNGSNWTQPFPKKSPGPRFGCAMAYDSKHMQVVLFGGQDAITNQYLGDTWLWDGSNWTQISPANSPRPRAQHTLVYDSFNQQMVFFGGTGNEFQSKSVFHDTWTWDGSNWTEQFPTNSPPLRYAHAMVYDSAQSQSVMFGGYDDELNTYGDTWVWDGSNWTQESPQTSPPARAYSSMAYDSAHGLAVLFGGENGLVGVNPMSFQFLSDTWTWGMPIVAPPPEPSITAVISASAFGSFSAVGPGSWIEIYGSNLAASTRGWTGADFNGNNAPTSLDGVKVDIGGQPAFVDYISPSQVNAQLPSDISVGGMSQLTVTNTNGASAPVNVTVNTTEPGLLAPASFKIADNQYVVAVLPDGNYVLPAGAIAGANSRPAKPGEIIVMYGIGFGPVTPAIPAGEIDTQTNQLSNSLQVLFGTTPAQLPYFGLAPGFVGLYQFNVVVPAVADSDLEPLTFDLGAGAGPQTLFTAVHQ